MKQNTKLTFITILLFLGFIIIPACQSKLTQEKINKIDELMNWYYGIGKFNGCVLVAENGRIIYQKAFGYTDHNRNNKLTLNHGFRLASVSKQFTAMAVMILQEQDKLSYEDDIRMYLSELPYKNMTIRHLLTHTSGLPDYAALLEEHWDTANKGYSKRKIASNGDALNALVKYQRPIKFNPGDRYEYCNTGYMLLGLIVERVTGERFQDFMKTHIFQPLGMKQTYVNEPTGILPEKQRAYGFKPNPEGTGYVADDFHFMNGMYGDGGIISTVKDLFKWDQALYRERLVSQATLDEAFTQAKLNDLSKIEYGFGWSVIQMEKGKLLSHGGGWVGFRAGITRDLAAKSTIIKLCNMPDIPRPRLGFIIYDILHGKEIRFPEMSITKALSQEINRNNVESAIEEDYDLKERS